MSKGTTHRNMAWALVVFAVPFAIATFFLDGETTPTNPPDSPIIELPMEEQPQNEPQETVHHSNGYRFVFTRRYYLDSDLPADTILGIFKGDAELPVERYVSFTWILDVIEDDLLSKEFVILREWGGGASCCWIIHAFQTKPGFKRLLTHNNDHFKPEGFVVGKDTLELYDPDSDKYSDPGRSHASLIYEPILYDLRSEQWLPFVPKTGANP